MKCQAMVTAPPPEGNTAGAAPVFPTRPSFAFQRINLVLALFARTT